MAKLDKKTVFKILLVLVIVIIITLVIQYIHIYTTYKAFSKINADYNRYRLQYSIYNQDNSFEFEVKDQDLKMQIWTANLTGIVKVSIEDSDNNIVFENEFKHQQSDITLHLTEGKYKFNCQVENYIGGLYIGIDNILVLNDD